MVFVRRGREAGPIEESAALRRVAQDISIVAFSTGSQQAARVAPRRTPASPHSFCSCSLCSGPRSVRAARWSGPQAPEECHPALGRFDVRTPGT